MSVGQSLAGLAHLNWILLESSAQVADPTELGSLLQIGFGLFHLCLFWGPGSEGSSYSGQLLKLFCGNGRLARGKGLGWEALHCNCLSTCISQSTSNGQAQRKEAGKYPLPRAGEPAKFHGKGHGYRRGWRIGENHLLYHTHQLNTRRVFQFLN